MRTYTEQEPGTLTTGNVYSTGEFLNVIMSSPDDIAGNNHFPAASGTTVTDAARAAVRECFAELRPQLVEKYPNYTVVITESGTRGRYTYTVWSH